MLTKESTMFRFKRFSLKQHRCAMKVGTDGVLLGAWVQGQGNEPHRILDVGTGTGLIATMLAQRFPQSSIDAVEIDTEAASQANENFRNSEWRDRLQLWHQSVQLFAANEINHQSYSLIVSNPPWFANSLRSDSARRNLARHCDSLTHDELLDAAVKLLALDGRFAVVLPHSHTEEFTLSAEGKGLICTRRCNVYPKPGNPPHRVLLEFSKHPDTSLSSTQELTIENEHHHDYTAEFRELTQDFYLRF